MCPEPRRLARAAFAPLGWLLTAAWGRPRPRPPPPTHPHQHPAAPRGGRGTTSTSSRSGLAGAAVPWGPGPRGLAQLPGMEPGRARTCLEPGPPGEAPTSRSCCCRKCSPGAFKSRRQEKNSSFNLASKFGVLGREGSGVGGRKALTGRRSAPRPRPPTEEPFTKGRFSRERRGRNAPVSNFLPNMAALTHRSPGSPRAGGSCCSLSLASLCGYNELIFFVFSPPFLFSCPRVAESPAEGLRETLGHCRPGAGAWGSSSRETAPLVSPWVGQGRWGSGARASPWLCPQSRETLWGPLPCPLWVRQSLWFPSVHLLALA